MKSSAAASRPPHAFTLVEVVAALVIFTALVGSILAFAGGSLRLSGAMREAAARQAESTDLVAFLGDFLEAIPANAEVEWGEGQLRIDVPMLLPLGEERPSLLAFAELALAEDALVLRGSGGLAAEVELSVLDGIESLTWRFHEPGSLVGWSDSGRRRGLPRLVAVEFARSGEPGRRHVFELTSLVAPSLPPVSEPRRLRLEQTEEP